MEEFAASEMLQNGLSEEIAELQFGLLSSHTFFS